MSLHDLGFRLQLGHDDFVCPNPLPSDRDIIVGDTSGLHVMSVDYCGCLVNGAFVKWDVQCLWHRLFPVTIKKPRTVFTFEAIELFHELTLQGKTTAYDFYRSMERMTDNSTCSPSVSEFQSKGCCGFADISIRQNQYKEFNHVVRLWRHLVALKRAGRCHAESGAAGTGQGELAVKCATCPHPGRNLPDDWMRCNADDK